MKTPKISEIITIEYSGSDADKTLIVGRVTGVQVNFNTLAIQIAGLTWIYFEDNKYSWKSV